jgi:ceroid-lipofuscinosis MFS transporter 7
MNRQQDNEIYLENYRQFNDDEGIAIGKSVSFDLNNRSEDNDTYRWDYNTHQPMNTMEEGDNADQDERQDFEEQDAITVATSVLTADGIADPTSFRINLLVIILGDTGRGIFFTTMWNLIKALGGNEVYLGYLVGSFSFGRFLVLPLFGYWSNIYGVKFVHKLTLLILSVGSFLFSIVLNVQKIWFMLLANTIIGVGSANLGVTFSYASAVTPRRKRTSYLALCCAVQYAGTTATPFIGSLYVWLLGEKNKKGFPEINEFTASALTMCVLSLIGFVLVHFYFEDAPIKPAKKTKTMSVRQQEYDSFANSPFCFGTTTLYSFALLSCMFMNAFTKGPMSCFETLGVAFAENRYGLERGTAGMIIASCGFLGCIILFMVKLTFNKHDDSKTTIFGILIFALGIALNLNLDRENAYNNPTWMYAFTMCLAYSVGYPICHTALVGLFSKIAGRRPQGVLQGFFSAAGSVARVSFPVIAGYIVSTGDIETLFILLLTVLGLGTFFMIFFRRTYTRLASD